MAANPESIPSRPGEQSTALGEQSFEIEQIGPSIGAEIRGLDFARPLGPATRARLEAALIEHKVVYARDQHITPEQHVALGRQFGELEVHPFHLSGEAPQLMVLDNHKDNPVLSTDVWHSDTSFRERPTRYSILRACILPPLGGDTLWADMCAAYDGLGEPLKRMLEGLRAVHDFQTFRRLFTAGDADQARLREIEKRLPNPSHPVVRTHPVSGRKAVYVNALFTTRIEGLGAAESRALLDLLCELPRVPEYQFRIRWQPGTLVFWDNRSTQHYACNDYYPSRRRMERVAVAGDTPV